MPMARRGLHIHRVKELKRALALGFEPLNLRPLCVGCDNRATWQTRCRRCRHLPRGLLPSLPFTHGRNFLLHEINPSNLKRCLVHRALPIVHADRQTFSFTQDTQQSADISLEDGTTSIW